MIEAAEDVTAQVLARPDAHPIKDHDTIFRVGNDFAKVRAVEHPKSTVMRPYHILTASLCDETGRALQGPLGDPLVLPGEHHLIFAAEEPAEGQGETDPIRAANEVRQKLARQVARAARTARALGSTRTGSTPPITLN